MKTIYTLILLLFTFINFISCKKEDNTTNDNSSTWIKTFGGPEEDVSIDVKQTLDEGFIITGHTKSFGNGETDIYLLKTDADRNEQWSKTFGGNEVDQSTSIQLLKQGFIITGFTYSNGSGDRDVYLLKTDFDGNEQWSKTFGGENGEYGHSVQQTTDFGYVLLGSTTSFGNGEVDMFLIKTDINGDSLWSKTFGGSNNDYGYSVQQTNDGGYILLGATTSFGNGGSDMFLIKTDINGDSLWSKTFGGTNSEEGYSIKQTIDGGYIITGNTWSFGNGETDIYLLKIDANGNEQWSKTFGGENSEISWSNSLLQTTDGGFIIAGHTQSFGNGGADVYLLKTDADGNEQWSKTFGGSNHDRANSVQQTNDSGYIITGHTISFGNGGLDMFLIKTDEYGNVDE